MILKKTLILGITAITLASCTNSKNIEEERISAASILGEFQVFDVGEIPDNKVFEYKVLLRNDTINEVSIDKAKTSCTCLMAEIKGEKIANKTRDLGINMIQDESRFIIFRYNPEFDRNLNDNNFRHSVILSTSEKPNIDIAIQGTIK